MDPALPNKRIPRFIEKVNQRGGFATSNSFQVKMNLPGPLQEYMLSTKLFADAADLNEWFTFMCEECQLPNVNTMTGQQNGLYTGLGSVDYVHTRMFTETNLTFMLDANMTALKFANAWHTYMFNGTGKEMPSSESDTGKYGNLRPRNRTTRVRYKDDYAGTIFISKNEAGPLSDLQREPITYILERAYPYQIDAVPLQYGATQLTKCSINFKYERHYTVNRDIRKIVGDTSQLGKFVGRVEVGPGKFVDQYLINGKIVERETRSNFAPPL